MDKKLAAWVITTGKSCSQPCFPLYFEYCVFPWTWHPEILSYQCVISRNSTAVTHFIKKQWRWNANVKLGGHTLYKKQWHWNANVKLGGHTVMVLKNKHWGVAVD